MLEILDPFSFNIHVIHYAHKLILTGAHYQVASITSAFLRYNNTIASTISAC